MRKGKNKKGELVCMPGYIIHCSHHSDESLPVFSQPNYYDYAEILNFIVTNINSNIYLPRDFAG